jgi:carnitine-CoA ligase
MGMLALPERETMVEPDIADLLAEIGHPTGTTFPDLIRHMSNYDPSLTAVLVEDGRYSYGHLLRMIGGAAEHLASIGVKQGDHVAYMVEPSVEGLVTFAAALLMGAVAVPIYSELSGEPLASSLSRYDIDVLVIDPRFESRIEPFRARLDRLKHVLATTGSAYAADVVRGGEPMQFVERSELTPASPALILSTSGSTGQPKGVVLGHSFSTVGYFMLRKWGMEDVPHIYHCTSFGHGAAVTNFSVAYWNGGYIVLRPRFSASQFWDDLRRFDCNHTMLLGTMHRMIFNQPERPNDADQPVRRMQSSGMPAGLWEQFEKRFDLKIMEVYSATDSGGGWLCNPGTSPVGSIGRPWKEMEARVVDDDGHDVEVGTIGELLMRPRGTTPVVSYYKDPEASAEKARDGWVWFGDNVHQDAEGNFYFDDRKRDIIRRRGVNLAPSQIEEVLNTHPAVTLACAFAVPSELGEDEIKVAVIRCADLEAEELSEFAERELPRHMRPRYIEFVDEVPRTTGTERVQRFRLQKDWATPTTWDAASRALMT